MKEVEIDYYENNEHINDKEGKLEVKLSEVPVGFVGTIEQEFIEILDEDGKPTGKFEEFIFKEIEEE